MEASLFIQMARQGAGFAVVGQVTLRSHLMLRLADFEV